MKSFKHTRKIKIENFRSIVMADSIEIRKINLLFGKNGSGKSSFIKAIRFFGENLIPVNYNKTNYILDNETNLGDFQEIVVGNDLNNQIEIEFEENWQGMKKEINYLIKGVFNLNDKDNGRDFSQATILIKPDNHGYSFHPHDEINKKLTEEILERDFKKTFECLEKFFCGFHIGAVRFPPTYKYKLDGGKFSVDSYYRVPYEIEKFKSEYGEEEYSGNMELFINAKLTQLGFDLGVFVEKKNEMGWIYTIDRRGTKSNLAEASSGLIQLVPILVKMFMLDYNENYYNYELPPQIMIMEQPELHLHPSLQTKLTEIISSSEGSYIIETHSEHIVRKLQVLVAQGKISRDDVAIYYFDKDEESGTTRIKELRMEDNGFFKDLWPGGFFDEASDLAYELIDAQINRVN